MLLPLLPSTFIFFRFFPWTSDELLPACWVHDPAWLAPAVRLRAADVAARAQAASPSVGDGHPPAKPPTQGGENCNPETSWKNHHNNTVLIDMVEHTNTRNIKNGEKKPNQFCWEPIWILEMGDNPKSSEDLQNTSQNHMTGLFLLVLSKFFYFAKKRNVNPPPTKKSLKTSPKKTNAPDSSSKRPVWRIPFPLPSALILSALPGFHRGWREWTCTEPT